MLPKTVTPQRQVLLIVASFFLPLAPSQPEVLKVPELVVVSRCSSCPFRRHGFQSFLRLPRPRPAEARRISLIHAPRREMNTEISAPEVPLYSTDRYRDLLLRTALVSGLPSPAPSLAPMNAGRLSPKATSYVEGLCPGHPSSGELQGRIRPDSVSRCVENISLPRLGLEGRRGWLDGSSQTSD